MLTAVTVYELAIKEILCTFASKKHKVLGHFAHTYIDRINGRIKLGMINDDYVRRFGKKYVDSFKVKTAAAEKKSLAMTHRSILSNYNNIY